MGTTRSRLLLHARTPDADFEDDFFFKAALVDDLKIHEIRFASSVCGEENPSTLRLKKVIIFIMDYLNKEIQDVQNAAKADVSQNGEAHAQLLEAIRKLNLAAETPAETMMRMHFQPLQTAAIRMAVEAGVLEAIDAEQGRPINAAALSKKTGYDELLIVRFMRLVTFVGVCEERGEGQYAATETTHLITTAGITGAVKHHFDLLLPIFTKLIEYMHKTGVHQFPKGPEEKGAFEYTHGMTLWEFMKKSEEHRKYFDDYMAQRRQGLAIWHETFPMASQLGPAAKKDPKAVLLVDIGGGWGHDVQSFHKTNPDVPGRLILQDLPIVLDKVERQGTPEGIELMRYDIFTPQPVKAARAYFLHTVCHDWSDSECRTFLSNTAKSMEKGYSRLLIGEYVLPNTNAPIRASSMDLLMMMYCCGIERTKRQWENLLDSCGLKIVKIWIGRSDYEAVIEAELKE